MRGTLALLLLVCSMSALAQEAPAPSETPSATAADATATANPDASPSPTPAFSLEVCAVAGRDGSAIPGATVVLVMPDGRAAAQTAGSNGCAVFPILPPATYKATVVAPGSKPADLSIAVPPEGGLRKVVALEIAAASEQEITVEAKREQIGETRRTIDPEFARTMPGTQGDALKAIQNLPGTARAPFGAGALIVRGAAPEDSRVFLDGQEIPQLYHFGGLTSVVPTEVLTSIDFLPGGFGVRYGRATGGVVDVETRGAHDKAGGLLDVSVYNTEVEGETPVGEGGSKGRIIAAGRRSYIDYILPAVVPKDVLSFTVAPRFYDYQFRYDAPSKPTGSQSHLLAYGSDDEFIFVIKKADNADTDVRGRFLFHTLFHRAQAPIVKPLSSGWVLTTTPGVGYQQVIIDVANLASISGERSDFTLRLEARGPVVPGVKLLVGLDGASLFNRYSLRFPDDSAGGGGSGLGSDRVIVAGAHYYTVEAAPFVEGQISLGDGMTLVPGLRVDGYYPTRGLSVDPRLAFRWEKPDTTVLKAYAGIYHQPPQFQEWDAKFGNPHLRSPWAIQVGAGAGRDLDDATHVEGELFYKWLQDLVAQAPGDPSNPSSRSHYTNEQIGRAYGLELLVKRELSEKLYGFLAYTLSKSERADPYTPDGWRPFEYDQTHIATAIVGYKLPRDWEMGVRFRYTTGNPTTGVAAAIYDSDSDNWVPIPGATNRERVPPFHQLDFRVDKRWTWTRWKLDAYLDVQNVYVHANPEGVRYDFDYEHRYYVTGLPILPLIGLRGEI